MGTQLSLFTVSAFSPLSAFLPGRFTSFRRGRSAERRQQQVYQAAAVAVHGEAEMHWLCEGNMLHAQAKGKTHEGLIRR